MRWVAVGTLAVCLLGTGCARWGFELDPVRDDDTADSGSPAPPNPSVDASVQVPQDASADVRDAGASPGDLLEDAGTGGCDGGACTDASSDASVVASCGDGAQNQGETAVDCGGPCAPCACTYGTPVVLGNPNYPGNRVFSPSLTSNLLQIAVGAVVGSNPEFIALATRPDTFSEFGLAPALSPPVNQASEGSPHLSPNGLSLYFYSTRSGGDRDLFRATRPSSGGTFDTVSELTTINSTGDDHQPWVSANDLEIYFVSDRDGNSDIYYASRSSTANPFGTPTAVAALNSTSSENGVALTADGLVAVITSSRGGVGGQDIFRAARASTSDPFSTPVLVAGVNSTADDLNVTLTPDGQFIYFSSNFNSSDFRVWRATRTCP